jgi:hypothetical protein
MVPDGGWGADAACTRPLAPPQDGPGTAYTAIPLPCTSQAGEAVGGAGACSFSDFVGLASPRALSSASDWCQVGS